MGLVLPTRAAHDSGETVKLEGVSKDGRFALVRIADVQRRYVEWLLSDVDGKRSQRRRFEGDLGGKEEMAFVADLRRRYRTRSAPKAKTHHPRKHVEGRLYTWIDDEKTLHRAFSLVGPLGQRVESSLSIRCFKEDRAQCPGMTQSWAPSIGSDVHWFSAGVYLVVQTWFVRDVVGDMSRAIFVHRRLPEKPQRPATAPD